jgi:Zn-dependent protease
MLGLLSISPILFVIAAATLLVAITVHEFAHALAADKLGDPTPRLQGRLTLNPLAHLDPLGTLGLLIFGFGWGKPVQFDPYNLQNPRRDAAIISFAGPLSNVVLVTIFSLFYRLFLSNPFEIMPVTLLVQAFVRINLSLAVFNLIPIHPLDGGKILLAFLPAQQARVADRIMRQYGFLILMAAILFPVYRGRSAVDLILGPVLNFFIGIYLPSPKFI